MVANLERSHPFPFAAFGPQVSAFEATWNRWLADGGYPQLHEFAFRIEDDGVRDGTCCGDFRPGGMTKQLNGWPIVSLNGGSI